MSTRTADSQEILYRIFSNVNDWLKFAETKNASLIVFNTAAAIGILQGTKCCDMPALLKGLMLVFFSISTCIALYTFLPILQKTTSREKMSQTDFDNQKENLNSYYFGDISQLTVDQFGKLLISKDPTITVTGIDRDIMSQIITNSEIAVAKYNLFNWGLWPSFLAVIVGIVVIIINIVS